MIAERSAVCAAMPEVHAALAAGTLSAGHADAIARAATGSTTTNGSSWRRMAPSLVEQAATTSVDAFARKVRDLARRISRDEGLRHHEKLRSQRTVKRWMDREGMCHTQISLDPEADARLSAAFDAAMAAEKAKPDNGRSFDQLKADAFMTMVTSTPVPGARHHAELLMLIDLETAPHRPPRVQRLRDLRRPAPPTSHRAAPGLRGEHHPDRVGRRRQSRRRRPSKTVGDRRSTTSATRHAPNLRRTGLPCALRGLRHPPPQRMERRRPHQPREPDPTVLQAPPPHPRRPMAPTSQSTRRLTGGRPAARPQARPVNRPSPPPASRALRQPDAAATRTARLCVTAQVPGDTSGDTEPFRSSSTAEPQRRRTSPRQLPPGPPPAPAAGSWC